MAKIDGTVVMQEEKNGNSWVIKIQGRLDALSAPIAERRIFQLIENGCKGFVLNLSEVDYLSSAGMRMLLSTTKKLKGVSGKVVLCKITPNVLDVLKMSGFDYVLECVDTEAEALALLARE